MKKFFTILVAAAAVSACFDNTGIERIPKPASGARRANKEGIEIPP